MSSISREHAAKRFPLSAKHGRIYGEGFFALVSRCNPRAWTVYLFPTIEARRQKIDAWELSYAGCRAVRGCNHDHKNEDLRPQSYTPAPPRNHTEQFGFFNAAMAPMYEKRTK